jgi:N-acetylmuramic acid 6-phosphate etherase
VSDGPPSAASPAATEARNPETRDLDLLATEDLVDVLVREQAAAALAVAAAGPALARAVDAIARRLMAGGSLHYVGAGTSGRLATLDAAECPPTFGTPPSLVVAHVAGGEAALLRAVEGAEDDAEAGSAVLRGRIVARDAVVGISASGGAPYVLAALETARSAGALTVAVTSDAASRLVAAADIAIVVETGAEPLAGSTRLRAGTAQKVVLSALSTAIMVRLGHVHDNLMVDVVATNRKLQARAERLVCELTGVDPARARELLALSNGSVKVAAVISRQHVDAAGARARLADSGGFLRPHL